MLIYESGCLSKTMNIPLAKCKYVVIEYTALALIFDQSSYYIHLHLKGLGRFHKVEDRPCEVMGGAVATHVSSPRFAMIHISTCRLFVDGHLPFFDNFIHGFRNPICMFIKT